MDFLGNRRKALEDAFFREQDEKNLANLRAELEQRKSRDELKAASGIQSEEALDQLVELGVTGQTVAALSLIPLLKVAWADGKIAEREREAVLQAAAAKGVDESGPTGKLLAGWLSQKPDDGLYSAWNEYIAALTKSLVGPQREILRKQIVGFARQVAESAGGFLGLASVSAAEEEALAWIEAAFAQNS